MNLTDSSQFLSLCCSPWLSVSQTQKYHKLFTCYSFANNTKEFSKIEFYHHNRKDSAVIFLLYLDFSSIKYNWFKDSICKWKKKKLIIFKIISKTVCLMEKQFGYGQCYTMVKKCYHVHGCSESARARAGTLPHAEMKHSHNEGFGFIHMLPWFIQMLLCHVSKEIESHAMTLKTWPCFRIRTVGLKLLL